MFDNIAYNLAVESDTSTIISHFDEEFVLDIVEDNLLRRINVYQPNLPNIVSAIEQHYKVLANNDEIRLNHSVEVLQKRNSIYNSIISLLCNRHNLVYTPIDETVDLYSISYYLYDFLVSNFRKYIVDFFTLYIYKEKNEIYNAFNLEDKKKDKDSSTIYGKKLYNDQKIAIINANLDEVLVGLCGVDVNFIDILNAVYENKSISNHIYNNIVSSNNFFTDIYSTIIRNLNYRQMIITDIRFALHQIVYS